MARGNMRGGRGRGRGAPGGFGRGGPIRGAHRGRGGFNGPPMGFNAPPFDDGFYNYRPPMLPPIPPQRLPPPPLPPVPPRSLMRGMPPMRRPHPPPFGGFRHPVPPLPPVRPPRLGFMPPVRGRGRGGRVLKNKNVVPGLVPVGFKRGFQAKKMSEKVMNGEIKKPWVTPELEAEIKKKYELFAKSKAAPSDEEAKKAFKEQEAVVTNLNVELRTKHTKAEELSKPWVGESLKAEIEKKYQLFYDAREKKDDEAAWTLFKEQKALVSTMFSAARTEYTQNTPEEDPTNMDENFAADDADAFSCETCCRGFPTQEQLDTHLGQHVTCGIDGCTLSAHPGILEVHVRFQHRTGLFKEINNAEVDKWIQDRKNRFPTLKTIEAKEQAKVEMTNRGERYEKNAKPFKTSEEKMERGEPKIGGVKRGGKNKKKRKPIIGLGSNGVESGALMEQSLEKSNGSETISESNDADKNTEQVPNPNNISIASQSTNVESNKDTSNEHTTENIESNEDTANEHTIETCNISQDNVPAEVSGSNGPSETHLWNETCNELPSEVSQDVTCNDDNSSNDMSGATDSCNLEDTCNDLNATMDSHNENISANCNKVTSNISDTSSDKIENCNDLNATMDSHIDLNISSTYNDEVTRNISDTSPNEIENFAETIDIKNGTCNEFSNKQDGLTSLMLSYVDEDSEIDDDDSPPLETRICKNEAEFEQTLHSTTNTGSNETEVNDSTLEKTIMTNGHNNTEDNSNVDIDSNSNNPSSNKASNNPSSNTTSNTPSNNKASNNPSSNTTSNTPSSNTTSNTPSSNTSSVRESRKRHHGKSQGRNDDPGRKVSRMADIRAGAKGGDPFDAYTHMRTTLRRHRGTKLLEKLLEDDIIHERNVILQCVHHIVKNNFFD
ncbi:hypothetical protein M8J76_001282 [Diaphorina citri]|nr:hypothetical protein M8J76_001282 [Diaphorina citri]